MKFTITTLGCKVNTAESEALVRELQAAGWSQVVDGEAADLCVVNTCTVTGRASMQSRQVIRQLQRLHPKAKVIVTGCYAQTEPEAIREIGGVAAVVGAADKGRLSSIIPGIIDRDPSESASISKRETDHGPLAPPAVVSSGTRTRPFLKVQDGCDQFCTYCIVPHARGRSRSLPTDAALEALAAFGAAGFQEVVLTGIHLGAYGGDLHPATHLLDLVERIEKLRPVSRVRLSSVEPNELSDDLIRCVAHSGVICPHFHLPLQSGDDDILKRMKRPYDRALFRDRVQRAREAMPHAAIGADVLAGFPGETEAAFRNTLDLIEGLPLTYLHVFPFSPRKGTPAFHFPDQVSPDVAKARCSEIRRLGDLKRSEFMEAQVGRTLDVLTEQRRDHRTGMLKGVSGNYQNVVLEGGDHLTNRIVSTKITGVAGSRILEGARLEARGERRKAKAASRKQRAARSKQRVERQRLKARGARLEKKAKAASRKSNG
ncbi:MAG: tRNA (N(6)-L-threonylcarbamoyladenosine(37)-C(2))-methylthiotransferase MtaB [Desulfobacterales bacterium]